MNAPAAAPDHAFDLAGARLVARPSGALWWPAASLLVVADLHLGKSERLARRGGALLPPYETAETLDRLAAEMAALAPARVLCLGDSFDDLAAGETLREADADRLRALMAGRRWIWAEGNHDPGPLPLGGEHAREHHEGPLLFRHAAAPQPPAPRRAEVSGHHHPKAGLRAGGRRLSRPCFVLTESRLILPAFGRYTGGLDVTSAPLRRLAPEGLALLAGVRVTAAPLSRLRGE
ncbi:MAG: ligase-associated DNA damage response endonuclease PdeM [Pseudomonadota bacterium]